MYHTSIAEHWKVEQTPALTIKHFEKETQLQ